VFNNGVGRGEVSSGRKVRRRREIVGTDLLYWLRRGRDLWLGGTLVVNGAPRGAELRAERRYI
jgi:hypothetical protein